MFDTKRVFRNVHLTFSIQERKKFYQHFSLGRSRLGYEVQNDTTKISLCAP